MDNNTLFIKILSELGIPYTKEFSSSLCEKYAWSNNMYGLSKLLNLYNISSVGILLTNKMAVIADCSLPFVAEISGVLSLVKKIEKDVVIMDNGNGELVISLGEFLTTWSGRTLLISSYQDSAEPYYHTHIKDKHHNIISGIGLGISLSALLLLMFFKVNISVGIATTFILDLVGVITSFLYVKANATTSNLITDKICSLIQNNGCNTIDKYRVSRPFFNIALSEIAFAYFSSRLIIAGIGDASHYTSFLFYVSIIALPVVAWSVWFQYTLRTFCLLCLIIDFILLATAFVQFSWIDSPIIVSPSFVAVSLSFFALFIFITLAWHVYLDLIKRSDSINHNNRELNAIKLQFNVFLSVLHRNKRHENSERYSSFVLGELDSKHEITLLTNPYCPPCAQMHKRIKCLYAYYRIRYVFTTFSSDSDAITQLFIAAYKANDKNVTSIIDDWFEKGVEQRCDFFNQYKLDTESSDILDETARHKEWKEKCGFSKTPTILFDGYEIPQEYQIEDIA